VKTALSTLEREYHDYWMIEGKHAVRVGGRRSGLVRTCLPPLRAFRRQVLVLVFFFFFFFFFFG
jgi:hypothetical protein